MPKERVDLVELAVAPHERRQLGGEVVLGDRPLERRVLLEDPLVQLAQGRPGFEPQLVGQAGTHGVEDARGFCLAAAAVQRDHQLPGRPLTQRVLGDQVLQLGDGLHVAAEGEVGLDAVLDRGEAEVLQAGGLGLGKRIEHKVGQRRPAPQRERSSEEAVCALRVAVERGLTLGVLAFEAVDIQLGLFATQLVAEAAREDHLRAKRAPQCRHVRLKRVGRRPRRPLTPQRVD